MDGFHIALLLAQISFGGGYIVGFAGGIGAGIAVGLGIAKKKFNRQLTNAIETGEITVVDSDGTSLEPKLALELLEKR